MTSIKSVIDWMEDMVSGFFLVVGLALVFVGVVMRYVFNSPIFWVDEVATYLIIWSALLGLGVALKDQRHIRVIVLYDKMPIKVRRWLSIFTSSVGLLFCIFFTYTGILLEKNYLRLGQASLNSQTPLWIPYIIVPVSGILFGLRFVAQLYNLFRQGGRNWLEEEERRINNVDSTTL